MSKWRTRHSRANLLAVIGVLWTTQPAAQAPGVAQERNPAELEALVDEATTNNPQIRAAAQRFEAAKAMVPQARTLPDPMLNLSYEDVEVRETMYGVSQEIPFPGKLRLRGEVAAREAEAMEQEYLAVRLGVLARLKEAYYDLLLARESAAIIEKNRRLLVQLSEAAEAGYEVGRMAQADVFRAQAEVSRTLVRFATVRQERQSATAALSRLLGRPPASAVEAKGELRATPVRHNLAETLDLVERSPMLRVRAKAVERSDAALALARREYLPDFEVGLQGVREEPMGENGYQLMFNVSVPLWYATKQRYGVREALASRAGASGDLEAMRLELAMQLRDEMAQIERAGRLIELLGEAIVPQAELTLASARSGYSVGRLDFLTLLNSLFTLQENELELQMEIAAHEKARARIEEIIGEEP